MTMSERQRAFDALRGRRFPCVGEAAWWRGPDRTGKSCQAKVAIVQVSGSGKTIWTRFVYIAQRRKLGLGPHRWVLHGHGHGGTVVYREYSRGMRGTVIFFSQDAQK